MKFNTEASYSRKFNFMMADTQNCLPWLRKHQKQQYFLFEFITLYSEYSEYKWNAILQTVYKYLKTDRSNC